MILSKRRVIAKSFFLDKQRNCYMKFKNRSAIALEVMNFFALPR